VRIFRSVKNNGVNALAGWFRAAYLFLPSLLPAYYHRLLPAIRSAPHSRIVALADLAAASGIVALKAADEK